jgi:hypothetical protein
MNDRVAHRIPISSRPHAGCNDAPPGTGTPGPNECTEVQVSAHGPTGHR